MVSKKIIAVIAGAAIAGGIISAYAAENNSTEVSEAVSEAAASASDAVSSASLAVDEELAAAAASAAEENAKEDNHILVVYYSASKNGNTATAANLIAGTVGADTFEISPKEPYTDEDLDYNDENSRVSKEHEDEDLQNSVELVTTTVDGWDSYDTVFIGYPIWWQNASWVLNQFVENNDFTGKTVIPFGTSMASGFGDSGENLAALAGTGDWQDGMRFSNHVDGDEVTEWAESVMEE